MTDRADARPRVTAADVARSLGLSRATVGFALNNTPGQRIPEHTRQRVIAEAERLGYRPHRAAQMLASGQSKLVLLVLPDWPVDHSLRVHLDEASHVLDDAGYSLVTMTIHQGSRTQPLWEKLNPDVVVSMTPLSQDHLDSLRRAGVTRIIAENVASGDGGHVLGWTDGPRRQVEHLVSRGRVSLAYAGTSDPRLQELLRSRRELSTATVEHLTGAPLTATADLDATNVDTTVASWLDAGVDGVVAYNDDVAALVAKSALRQGIAVPDRVAVIGHDDTPLASLFLPALSSVHIDNAGLGRYMAALALSAIEGAPAPASGVIGEAVVVQRETT